MGLESEEILTILKVAVMIIFFVIVTVFGTLPIRSRSFKKRPLLKAIGSTFAGCLFLNVAIMHILPEAADTIEEHMKDGDETKQVFPLAYLLVMVGFIITVFFTKVLSFHSHDEGPVSEDIEDNITNGKLKTSLLSQSEAKFIENPQIQKASSLSSQGKPKATLNPSTKVEHEHAKNDHDHYHDHNHSVDGHQNKPTLNQAFILTIAIYFHTIFEGIAIGVQSNITGFLSTAVAIGFHKWADALSMGCHYKSKNVSKKLSYILIMVQAVLNVLAIGLGWLIESEGDLVQAIFLSISAGTFLAISTLEMLGEQLHTRKYMAIKFGLLVGSTAFVAAIWFLENSIFEQS